MRNLKLMNKNYEKHQAGRIFSGTVVLLPAVGQRKDLSGCGWGENLEVGCG